jgi:glycosyltransferase involved in cell wall biosynthesis
MSEPLSIAFLSHMASAGAPTGAERSLALLAGGLRERGHRVVVVAPGPWTLAPELEERGVEVRLEPCRVCWLAYYEPVPFPVAILKWARCVAPGSGRHRLRRFLEGWKADVAHVNCLPHVHGAAASRQAGLPLVWHLREILPEGARRRWFARHLEMHAARIVSVSEAVASWVRAEGLGERVTVVPNGEAAGRFPEAARARSDLGLPSDGCLVGLFGQVLPHKGVVEFVRAAKRALNRESGLRFVVAGSGPESYLATVREEIRKGGSEDRFRLLPGRPGGEMLIAAADVVCLTTRTPDPLPRTVLEAMAAGKPVAAFRSGGTPEMVDHARTGLLVDVGDLDGLADALVRLGEDEDLRRTLGSAGREKAERSFSIDLHLDRMEQILRQVAAE